MGVQNQKWQWQGYVRNRFFLRLHSLCTRALAHPIEWVDWKSARGVGAVLGSLHPCATTTVSFHCIIPSGWGAVTSHGTVCTVEGFFFPSGFQGPPRMTMALFSPRGNTRPRVVGRFWVQNVKGPQGVQVQVKNIQRPLACFYRLHGWARGLSWLAAMESPGFVIVIMPLICFPTTTIQFADIKSHTQKINHRDLLPQAAWKRPTQNHGRTPRRKSLMPWLYHTSLASSIYTCVWLPESRYMDVP